MTDTRIAKTTLGAVKATAIAAALSTSLALSPAAAQSVAAMTDECARVGKEFFREPAARTEMQYNGQRTDGTHAINGRIFLETRFEDFACSYRRDGQRMVAFSADGREQNAYLPGGGASTGGGELARVTGVAANDVLNVRSGPGTNYAVVGALANGAQVRNLRCQMQGPARWCEIEMMTDMRERGWVNARYLSAGVASQLPSQPALEAGVTRTVKVRFPSGTTGTELREEIAPGASIRFVLGARNGQMLYTHVAGDGLEYQIFLPGGRLLQDRVSASQEYRGQLFMSGDHVVEVINRTNGSRSFNIIMSAE
jgi:uncharacterized protein YgiM (DUF1202 family)